MIFDPMYLLIGGVGLLLSLAASGWVKLSFRKWKKVPLRRQMTGRDVAAAILRAEGITGVTIEEVKSFLGDHYDPTTRTLRLSPDNYRGSSVAAAGIAAHEVGHAIQHKVGYGPMAIRQKMVPVANIGTNAGVWMVILGSIMGFAGLAKLGVILFAAFVVFTLVTLPVEFNASSRAKHTLQTAGIVTGPELAGVSSMLTAAAATYVAAAIAAVLQLLYFVMRLGLFSDD
jgi:uncharacterized protein